MINPIIGILILPEVFYIYLLSKRGGHISYTSRTARAITIRRFRGGEVGRVRFVDERISQNRAKMRLELEIKRERQREMLFEKYNGKTILRKSIILCVGLLTIFILFVIFNVPN